MLFELESDNLGSILSENEKVFVMFGASWCGACRMIKPKIKKMATENEQIKFVYVDAEHMTESRGLASPIRNLPTFAAFSGSEVIAKEIGTKSIQSILESLN